MANWTPEAANYLMTISHAYGLDDFQDVLKDQIDSWADGLLQQNVRNFRVGDYRFEVTADQSGVFKVEVNAAY